MSNQRVWRRSLGHQSVRARRVSLKGLMAARNRSRNLLRPLKSLLLRMKSLPSQALESHWYRSRRSLLCTSRSRTSCRTIGRLRPVPTSRPHLLLVIKPMGRNSKSLGRWLKKRLGFPVLRWRGSRRIAWRQRSKKRARLHWSQRNRLRRTQWLRLLKFSCHRRDGLIQSLGLKASWTSRPTLFLNLSVLLFDLSPQRNRLRPRCHLPQDRAYTLRKLSVYHQILIRMNGAVNNRVVPIQEAEHRAWFHSISVHTAVVLVPA